ncbi:MAG: methylated-DNA--[protein]-cysteine S-methyltransferase [Candidatus Binatia bacterium]
MPALFLDKLVSPIGTLLLVSDGDCLYALDFADCEQRMMALLRRRYRDVWLRDGKNAGGIRDLIGAYLHGDCGALDRIAVNPGGTKFQQKVWSALRMISPGAVRSYRDMAIQLECPRAARAVGAANALNPVAIVIPCHRLVGSSGALTGYAGGLERKRWLLEHERRANTG